MEATEISIGQKVTYCPQFFKEKDFRRGIIKNYSAHYTESVYVVYNCDNDWENFDKYTGVLTPLTMLRAGWN